jgi:CBS-domain-containing membrane protein
MSRSLKSTLDEFLGHWRYYILQSLLATVSVYLVLILLNSDATAIVASLGATAFVVFAMPKAVTAQPRNVLGGHIVGLLCGLLGVWLLKILPVESRLFQDAIYAIAVGLSIFVMVVTDTEHPPAAGTALGVATRGFSINIIAGVLVFAVLFTLIRLLLKNKLRDLA